MDAEKRLLAISAAVTAAAGNALVPGPVVRGLQAFAEEVEALRARLDKLEAEARAEADRRFGQPHFGHGGDNAAR